jgi:hypothetical protein
MALHTPTVLKIRGIFLNVVVLHEVGNVAHILPDCCDIHALEDCAAVACQATSTTPTQHKLLGKK